MASDSTPLRTVRRAFEILHLLRDRGELGVTAVATELSIPKSTVHDYLRTLRTMGYVVNDAGTYRLGFRLLELGGQAKYRNRLFQVARPELERLAADTGEIVSLNVEERGEFVVLHAEFGERSLRLGVYPGLRTPIHTHAAGKVMLAGFDSDRVDRIVDRRGLPPRTDHTTTDRDELDAELDSIADRFDVAHQTIQHWIDKHDIEADRTSPYDKPELREHLRAVDAGTEGLVTESNLTAADGPSASPSETHWGSIPAARNAIEGVTDTPPTPETSYRETLGEGHGAYLRSHPTAAHRLRRAPEPFSYPDLDVPSDVFHSFIGRGIIKRDGTEAVTMDCGQTYPRWTWTVADGVRTWIDGHVDPPGECPEPDCEAAGIRNLGDGRYTCSRDECDSEFGRATAKEVLGR